MKIVHVCNRYYPFFGGLETHVQSISERMVKGGHKVWVYSTDPSGKLPALERVNGVIINRFKSFAPSESYYLSFDMYHALQKVRCDIIHGHDLHGFPLLSAALAKSSQKFIATLHTGGSSSFFRNLLRIPYDRIIMRHFLKRADKIICVSQNELNTYLKILRLPASKFVCIPNGTDLINANNRYSNKSSRIILSVGRLEKSKGFHFLIRSFAIICKDEKFDDVKLVIVGKGPYKSRLVKLISKLKLMEKVSMLQDVPRGELVRLYMQCKAFALLSKYESAALVILDALALRKSIITTRGGVLGDYVDKGLSIGVEWPPNPEDVATKIEEALENPSKHKPSGIQVFSWADVTQRLISVYNDVLAGK